jgi:hypothetical protein
MWANVISLGRTMPTVRIRISSGVTSTLPNVTPMRCWTAGPMETVLKPSVPAGADRGVSMPGISIPGISIPGIDAVPPVPWF